MTKLSVLGGSSPFTAALIDALLAQVHCLPKFQLELHGRDVRNLEGVARYAAIRLQPFGWSISTTTNLSDALSEAFIIIHQIRYGGLEGRGQDEGIAAGFGAAADETLGPAALHSILRTVCDLRRTSREIARVAPNAWVLNLTNPLSAVTTVMLESGVKRCIGLCELPRMTAIKAAGALDRSMDELTWQYCGLNHRGFIVSIKDGQRELLSELPGRMNGHAVDGVTAREISEVGALPTKYYGVISGRDRPGTGRAAYLSVLREKVASDIFREPERASAALQERYTEWYSLSVVPFVAALYSPKPSQHMVNILRRSGLVEEVSAQVSSNSFHVSPDPPTPSATVERWMKLYRAQEHGVLRCVENPCLGTITEALLADPVTPPGLQAPIAAAIWKSYQAHLWKGAEP